MSRGPPSAARVAIGRCGLKYRADIEGLRALAVLPVVFFHLQLGDFSGGYVGVDIFFVISGYLITSIITDDIANDRFSIARFYNRRIKRLFPALYFMIFVCVLFSPILLPRDMASFGTSIAAVSLFASNVLFWLTTGYFDAPSHTKPLLHTWSLAVEEQFYLLFPLVLFALRKQSERIVLGVMAITALASLVLCVWATPRYPSFAFYLPLTRAWELLLGAYLARAKLNITNETVRQGGGVLGLALIVFAIFSFEPTTPFPGWAAIIPTLGAGLLLATGPRTLAARILSFAPATYIGKISYSLYLWHWPVIVFVKYYFLDQSHLWVASVCLVASFVLAAFSYHVVETPFRKPAFRVRTVLASGFAVAVIFMGIGLVGRVADGFPARYPVADQVAEDPASYHRRVCFLEDSQSFADWSEQRCTFAATKSPAPKVLLWGDSYAAHLTPGFLALQKDQDFALVEMTMTGCPPVSGYDEPGRANCRGFSTGALGWIGANKPDLLVVSARWNRYRNFGVVEARLRETLEQLARSGQKIVIVGESPFYDDPVPQIRAVLAQRGLNADRFAPSNAFSADAPLRRLAADIGAEFYAPRGALCRDDRCAIALDGELVHWDQGHLTEIGSTAVVRGMAAQIAPPK